MPMKPPTHRPPTPPKRDNRPSFHKRGYTRAWAPLRMAVLRDEPLCRECAKAGRGTPATQVDHVIPHRGDPELMWDRDNLQPLCHACHSAKTATEDGGFGRPVQPKAS